MLPAPETAVFITRVGDEITISWQSEPGMLYTLVSKDRSRKDAQWEPVFGYVRMPGTGRQERITLTVPSSDQRAYNIRVEPAQAQRGAGRLAP